MEKELDLKNFAGSFSLIFDKPSMERKFQDERATHSLNKYVQIAMIALALGSSAFFLFMIIPDYSRGEMALFITGIVDICICCTSIFMELMVHCSSKLRWMKGFFVSVGAPFGTIYYSFNMYNMPMVMPGSLLIIIGGILGNVYFSLTWLHSVVFQILNQAVITTYMLVRFLPHHPFEDIASCVFNFNSQLILLPFLFYISDLSRRKAFFAHWATQKEMKFWKKVVSNLPVGLLIVKGTDIIEHNRTIFKLFSPTTECLEKSEQIRQELVHTTLFVSQNSTLHETLFSQSKEAEEISGVKYIHKNSQNVEVPLAISTFPVLKGREKYKVCLIEDHKIIDELQQEKVKGQYQKTFLAMITHELRNPLHAILGILDLLKMHVAAADLIHSCNIGINSGKLMMSLVNDILDISQLEANKLTLIEEEFDPVETAKECIEIMNLRFEEKKLYLKLIPVPPILPIKNDKRRYSQIIINLLSNSMKFTTAGGVKVTLAFDSSTKLLATSVEDSGKGMKKTDVAKLFKMYERLGTTVSNPQGVGLGLNICQKLSEQMGGKIEVLSEVGIGTTFTFTIASRYSELPGQMEESKKPPVSWPVEDHKTLPCHTATGSLGESSSRPFLLTQKEENAVLVIDDDYASRFVLKQQCEMFMAKADTANSGEDGLERVVSRLSSQEPYKLIFVDMYMPGIGGIETAQQIFLLYGKAKKKCVIIGLSGNSDPELQMSCEKAGMATLLVKPFDKTRVREFVESCAL